MRQARVNNRRTRVNVLHHRSKNVMKGLDEKGFIESMQLNKINCDIALGLSRSATFTADLKVLKSGRNDLIIVSDPMDEQPYSHIYKTI